MNPVVKRAVKETWRAAAGLTQQMRALPDFMVIGTQKGGTSSLLNYLLAHPNVGRHTRKEIHYFDREYHRGPAWYRGHFPLRAGLRLRAAVTGGPAMCGESSPSYLAHPQAASRAAALVPGARLVVLLRNPIERAHSHFRHQQRRGQEDRPLEEALGADLDAGAPRLWGEGAVDGQWNSYLNRGRYIDQLLNWEAHFPRGQMLVVCSEDLFRDPRTEYARVLEFLGLPTWEPAEFEKHNFFGSYGGMSDALRDRLRAYFAPYNQRLYAHLGRDFGWD
jgi:hypothetical protein